MRLSPEFERRARPFLAAGVLTEADVYAVALTAPRFGVTDAEILLGLAFAVRAPRVGHPAVELLRIAEQVADDRKLRPFDTLVEPADESLAAFDLPWPEPAAWARKVHDCSWMVGQAADKLLPFVLQLIPSSVAEEGDALESRSLLMTRRMHREQERVASALKARALATLDESALVADLERTLLRLFGGAPDSEAIAAVRLAATQPLAIILGGPGTGKTYSVSRLLGALLSKARGPAEFSENAPLNVRIVLAAPTGKAAARLREALREATKSDANPALAVDENVRELLQKLPSQTLHGLLGVRPDGTCRHHAGNPIAANVVVVDEVSMVDVANMRRLLEAVPPKARLILLGDCDQLASVEAGCVLADLVEGGRNGQLKDRICTFTVSRRFAAAPDIGLVAACLQSHPTGHPDVKNLARTSERLALAVEVLTGVRHAHDERVGAHTESRFADGSRHQRIECLGEPVLGEHGFSRPSHAQLSALAAPYTEGFTLFEATQDARGYQLLPVEGYAALLRRYRLGSRQWNHAIYEPEAQRTLLQAFERYRVLAVHRRGPLGVAGLERELATRVRSFLYGGTPPTVTHWIGRPILITENAYDVKLMNGDIGLILPTPDGPAAVFASADESGVRVVATSRLPPHEGALAITVHKSQGSQFDRVALVLAGRPSPVQTRELVYTGVTRAKNQLAWLGGEKELRSALALQVARASGLAELLR